MELLSVIPNLIKAKILNSVVIFLLFLCSMIISGSNSLLTSTIKLGYIFKNAESKF